MREREREPLSAPRYMVKADFMPNVVWGSA